MQNVQLACGAKIVHIHANAKITAFAINSTDFANARRGILAIDANWSAQMASMDWIVRKRVVVKTVVNATMCPANVHALLVLRDHCVLKHARTASTEKNVNKNANVRTMVNAIPYLENVNVRQVYIVVCTVHRTCKSRARQNFDSHSFRFVYYFQIRLDRWCMCKSMSSRIFWEKMWRVVSMLQWRLL